LSDFSFVTNYPAWFFLLSLAAGLLFATLLYWANPFNRFSKTISLLLYIFRFLTGSILAFLLLGPYLMHMKKETEEAVILLAQDNSSSLMLNADSSFYRNDYLVKLDSLTKALQNDYPAITYLFGADVTAGEIPDYSVQQTDISKLIMHLENTWKNKHVGALVLLTDGLFNQGINPLYASRNLSFPAIVVALGDTTVRPDLALHELRYNRIAHKQSEFPVEVTIAAKQAVGKKTALRLLHKGQVIFEEQLHIASNRFSKTMTLTIEPTETGQQRYTILLDELPGEMSLANNKRDFYVDVVDKKQQILILAHAPHPDIGALKTVLDDHYDVTLDYIENTPAIPEIYSLVIFHQLPANQSDFNILNQFTQSNPHTAQLFVLGSQTNLNYFNRLQTGLTIEQGRGAQLTDALPSLVPEFNLFTLEKTHYERISKFPPLSVYLANYSEIVTTQKLITQKISGLVTENPLIALSSAREDQKKGFITGTGIWRWRMHDFNQNGNQSTFNTIILKTVNYLIVQQDNRRLKVLSDNEFLVNDNIVFRAELRNPSFELINEPNLQILISNEDDNTQYPFSFSKSENTYTLNAGRLPEGAYAYEVSASFGGENLNFKGSFRVLAGSLEERNTVANHEILFEIADQTGGFLIYPEHMTTIADSLQKMEGLSTIAYYNKRYEPLISFGWLFGLITALLFVEWLVRKIYGSY
jgi:hypothetical protein